MRHNRKTSSPGEVLFILSILFLPFLPVLCGTVAARELSGVVVDGEGSPIKNAMVSVQGSGSSIQTDIRGNFRIEIDDNILSGNLTAGKYGYFNGAQEIIPDAQKYRIELHPLPVADEKDYRWLLPRKGEDSSSLQAADEKACQRCHPELTEEWQKDAHSRSAVNPLFLAFYNGSPENGEQKAGPGYKTDFPEANGNCADCHVPALALARPFQADPNHAQGVEREGIFCDFCHKINGVSIDQTGSLPGVRSLQLLRPSDGRQVFFGPYADVYPGDDAYHPLYARSHYCAPCHNGKFWDVLAYSEFQEWNESSYKTRNIHCQTCHMPPTGNAERFALQKEGGIVRNPATIPSHFNLGVQNEAFMKQAIDLKLSARETVEALEVVIAVSNVNAGHHYPTGSPMRNMILLVTVQDAAGRIPKMLQGEQVPLWGGVGAPEEGNYAGMPGKGYAKVLRDAVLYPDQRRRHFTRQYPAPHWRPTIIESDTRIPAEGIDETLYRFKLSENLSWPITVTARLIYRRSYKPWMDAMNLKIPDMEIAREEAVLKRRSEG